MNNDKKFYINGSWVEPTSHELFAVHNGREWGAFAFDEYLETKAVICREITPAQ